MKKHTDDGGVDDDNMQTENLQSTIDVLWNVCNVATRSEMEGEMWIVSTL